MPQGVSLQGAGMDLTAIYFKEQQLDNHTAEASAEIWSCLWIFRSGITAPVYIRPDNLPCAQLTQSKWRAGAELEKMLATSTRPVGDASRLRPTRAFGSAQR